MYIIYDQIDENIGCVDTILYDERLFSKDTISKDYIKVDTLKSPEIQLGKQAVAYVNLAENSVFYEYVDEPIDIEVDSLKKEIDSLRLEIEKMKNN